MKELLLKGFSSLLFDCTTIKIPAQLKDFNNHSTRWVLISNYWFRKVPLHFAAIFLLALFGWALFAQSGFPHPIAITLASLIAFPILMLSFYTPQFTAIFLPELYKATRPNRF